MRRSVDENEELNRRQAIALASTSTLSLLLAGCGGGGSTPNPNPTPTPSPSPVPTPNPNAIILQPAARVLPTDGSVTILSVTDTEVILAGSGVPSLAPGNVILSAAGQGLLRKIIAISPLPDGSIQVQTQQATLEEAFVEAQFTLNKTINASEFTVTPMMPGVTVVGRKRGREFDIGAINFNFASVKFEDEGPATIELSGDLSLTVSVDIDVLYKFGKLQYARFLPKVKDSLELTLSAKLSKELEKKRHVARLVGSPIPVAAGFVLVPVMDVYTSFKGRVEIGAEFTSSISLTIGAGVEYRRGEGWKLLTVFEPSTDDLIPSADAYVSAAIEFTPTLPEFSLLLNGVAGPYANTELPRYEAEFRAVAGDNSGMHFSAYANFTGATGFRAEILGYEIGRVDYPAALSEKIGLVDKFFPATGGVSVGIK